MAHAIFDTISNYLLDVKFIVIFKDLYTMLCLTYINGFLKFGCNCVMAILSFNIEYVPICICRLRTKNIY